MGIMREKSGLENVETKKLLEAPPVIALKEIRKLATLATFLFHSLRASRLSGLTPASIQNREEAPPSSCRERVGQTTIGQANNR